MLFGSGADIVPSEEPVRVRLPDITSGGSGPAAGDVGAAAAAQQQRAELAEMLRQTRGGSAAGGSSDSDGSSSDEEMEEAGALRQLPGEGAELGSSDSSDSEVEGEEGTAAAAERQRRRKQQRRQQQGPAGGAADADAAPGELDPAKAAAAAAAYAARDAAGAPQPLAPELVTLSMLPRTQWQNLVHLDTIKARNKPIEPPKKPAAAPFFLPTLAGVDAGRNPVFDFGATAGGDTGAAEADADAELAAKAGAAWGDSEDEEMGGEEQGEEAEERRQDGAADAAGSSDEEDGEEGGAGTAARQRQRPPLGRVLRTRAQAEHSHLVRLLHACAHAGDWTSLVAHLRSLPPVALDAEIRSMQVGFVGSGGVGKCCFLAATSPVLGRRALLHRRRAAGEGTVHARGGLLLPAACWRAQRTVLAGGAPIRLHSMPPLAL